MSIKLMSCVFELPLRPADKLVLLAIADHANDEGHGWPSIETLANKSSVSRRTVLRILKGLEGAGLLNRQKRSRKNGSRTSSLYKLTLGDNLSLGVSGSYLNDTAVVSKPTNNRSHPTSVVTTRTTTLIHQKNPSAHFRSSDLTDDMRTASEEVLARLPRHEADQVRKEWLSRLSSGGVKSPISYLTTLVKRAATGSFHASMTQSSLGGRSTSETGRSGECSPSYVVEHLTEIRSKLASGRSSC